MILDKKGKLFGKISIIDLVVIVAILVAIAGFAIRFFSPAADKVTNRIDITYVVKIEDVREYTVNALEKLGTATDKKSKSVIGEVVSVRAESRVEQKIYETGETIDVLVPEKHDVYVTVKAKAKESDKAYMVGENVEITVGSTMNMATKYANSTGEVVSITLE